MHNSKKDFIFSNWNPHFTPPELSRRLSAHVPSAFVGAVVDPACGAGNLLAATALRTKAGQRPVAELEFVGIDVSERAVRDCKAVLSGLLPKGNFKVKKSDFFRDLNVPRMEKSIVVMNPPFCGYGRLSSALRRKIATLNMRGRPNLGYAFVRRAIVEYRPSRLISLLPSNWIYSRASAFRSELDQLGGRWEWEDVGDDAFDGIDAHVGILLWRPKEAQAKSAERISNETSLGRLGLEVRQGVATGRDQVFVELAKIDLPFGTKAVAAKGRDVARRQKESIWIPPASLTKKQTGIFSRLSRNFLKDLGARSCVKKGRKELFQYHESMPDWFIGVPKLLVPEIVTGSVRVGLDRRGAFLPLHSVIAIKLRSIYHGRKLKSFLETSKIQKRLLASGPKLSGGAGRLQVGAIREVLNHWKDRQG